MRRAISLLVAGTISLAAPILYATEYHVDTVAARQVKFISKASIESFEGVTQRIDGYAVIPPDALQAGKGPDSSRFYFEVDLNALDTGIGLRNRHMRENYLETDQYPFAQYAGSIAQVSRTSDTSLAVSVSGDMTIHGVKRSVQATLSAGPNGQRYHIRGQFPVALPDYKIKIPKLMFMKISDTVQVKLDFYLMPISGSKEGQ